MNENPFRLPAGTHIGHVHLVVQSLERCLTLYQDLLGFSIVRRDNTTVELSASARQPVRMILTELPNAQPRSRRSPGLFHTAILFPNRTELANILRKLLQANYPFQGFADHGVSEALYLADPEGNGIELYADRPREQWKFRNGNIAMVTEPLDVETLLGQASEGDYEIHPETRIGHVHLQVSDLNKAETFYHNILGFDVTQRSYPGALFLSAGGYHHHIGVNIWNSRESSPAPPNTLGLSRFNIEVPDPQTIYDLQSQFDARSYPYETVGGKNALQLSDFDGIQITISSNH